LYKEKDVTISITSPFADLWEGYFRNFGSVRRENNTVIFNEHADTVILTIYKTNVSTRSI
jgi:hypothetical protein